MQKAERDDGLLAAMVLQLQFVQYRAVCMTLRGRRCRAAAKQQAGVPSARLQGVDASNEKRTDRTPGWSATGSTRKLFFLKFTYSRVAQLVSNSCADVAQQQQDAWLAGRSSARNLSFSRQADPIAARDVLGFMAPFDMWCLGMNKRENGLH
jgi:hypothetical protein